jgi:hypothetical protein
MAFTKYASFEVSKILDVKGSPERDESASLNRVSSFNDYRTEDGYLYARIRAISSRVNKNHDGWPSVELAGNQDIFDHHTANSESGFTVEASKNAEYGFSTFLGKPIFVDHHNSDPSRARGVIVDAKFHVEDHKTAAQKDSYYQNAPANHMPPSWVELLLEVDAISYPKLAKAILDGSKNAKNGIDGFSMGCDVERSVCNICKNSATTPDEFCNHVRMKGAMCDYIDPKTGHKTSKKSYEDCYGIKFFEISAVFDPADETALIREVRSSVTKESSMNKIANQVECPTCQWIGEPVTTQSQMSPKTVCSMCNTEIPEEVLAQSALENRYRQSSMNKFAPIGEYDKYFGGTGAAKKAYDSMIDQYGEEKGKEVFYATMNKKKNKKEGSDKGFVPPESVQNNARRGLEMVEAGEAGDGLEGATKGRARDIAAGKALSLDHVKRMHSFFERHDKTRPDDGGKGNSPWKTAWMLWGGDSGRSWAESVVGKEIGHDKNEKTSADKPQSFKTRAPEEVNTLREDTICKLCGEIIDGPQCDVCGYEPEPESFADPDLSKAKQHDEKEERNEEEAISSLESSDTNISPTVAHVSDTGWEISSPKMSQINKIEKPTLPVQSTPASNEPKDHVVKDQKEPQTSSVRTAADFLAAIKERKRNNMETHIADAQTSAPAVAKPDYHTDVTGTGGVGDATNESASNADAQVNVTDIGGISGVGTGDEETTNVAQGDEKSRNIPAIHTDVFGDNGTEAVTSDSGDHLSSWKIADVIHEGAEPSDPSGRPNKGREDISDLGKATDRTTGDSGPTSVWTKEETEAAGRSVNPVDKASDASDAHQNSDTWSDTEGPKDYATGDHKAHIMSAFKLADTEIELGLLDASQKYARIAELEKAAPAIVEASLDYANRVKTAGLKKSARVSRRLPSLVKGASTTASQTQEGSDDSALFM